MKRLVDIVLSLSALMLLAPLLLLVSILIAVFLGRPVFFRQQRPGLNGEIFTLIKFRSMRDAKDPAGELLPDEKRLTRFGKFLRATSIDEVPELWNVLRGEMSLVGPRPLLVEYMPKYSDEQRRRHEVRPGITGWAQVNGRNSLDWESRFAYDVWYVDNQTFWLDMKILFLTAYKVVRADGISQAGQATMERFPGREP